MNLSELWNSSYIVLHTSYAVLGIVGTLMSVFGIPSIAAIYHSALKKQMKFSPALAFAHTYFSNFITPVFRQMSSPGKLIVKGNKVEKIFIQMPSSLTDVSSDKINLITLELAKKNETLLDIAVETPSGKRTILSRENNNVVLMFDIPRIISSLEMIITEFTGKTRQNGGAKWEKIEKREIKNFCSHVRKLIRINKYDDMIKVFNCPVPEFTSQTDDLGEEPRKKWWPFKQ